MGALLVLTAHEVHPGQLLLRLGEYSLTQNIDPNTEQPGGLPRALVTSVRDVDEDNVIVAFEDGSDLVVDRHAYVEAV